MSLLYTDLPLTDLVALLRKEADAWFNNTSVLLLEELIRRAEKAEKQDG